MPYVPSIDQFVGNEKIKELISLLSKSRIKQKLSFPHTLISGPAGTGKTTLAIIIASLTSYNLVHLSATSIGKSSQLRYSIVKATTPTVFFIDELHALSPAIAEELYYPIEEHKVLWSNQWHTLPPATFVGATTEPDRIPKPLKSRFALTLRTDFYSLVELSQICTNYASYLQVKLSDNVNNLLAIASKGIPRNCKHLLELSHDLSSGNKITSTDIEHLLTLRDIGAWGLDNLDRQYLSYVISYGPVGIKTISSVLGESEHTIEQSVEPYLMRMGFILKTNSGRIATDAGRDYFKV